MPPTHETQLRKFGFNAGSGQAQAHRASEYPAAVRKHAADMAVVVVLHHRQRQEPGRFQPES